MNSLLSFITNIFSHAATEEALLMAAEVQIKPEEGYRSKPYPDTQGKITIGWGFNLTDIGLYPEEADFMMKFRVQKAMKEVLDAFPWSESLSEARRIVLIDMAYNLGIGGLKAFTTFLSSLASGNYEKAASDMMNSLWAKEVGQRAVKLSEMIRQG